MAISEHLLTCTPVGTTTSGNAFSDKSAVSALTNARISKITIWYSDFVGCLKVGYNNQEGTAHGGNLGGNMQEITLAPDEYISAVEGSFGGSALSRFKLTTNKSNVYGPFGTYSHNPTRSPFNCNSSTFRVAEEVRHTLGLQYFSGTCDESYIWSLGATFMQFGGRKGTPLVKYEKQAPADPATVTESVVLLSEFTRNIMSPIATLLVGPSQCVFHVYEKIVCRLPFFTAALNGQFCEASHKRITMPEDDPSSIAALMEFLYTGYYTYPYISEEEESGSDNPKVDRAEGIFHVGVFVVASKYDSQELSKATIVALANVLDGLKGIECVRLWKEAYKSGLSLDHVKDFPELNIKMVHTLKDVYAEHKEEMGLIVKEIPELGNDFLSLLVQHAKL